MFEPNTHRYTNCEWCGKRFVDDCGDSFCSSRCEDAYNDYHKSCMTCGAEQEDDTWHNEYVCDDCSEKENEE